jgi:type IV secretory pathway TraG/TraD family ATPase VirD4
MKFYVGRKWNPATGRIGRPQYFDLGSHMTLEGPTGCGKGAAVEIPNLLGDNLRDCNVVSIDPTGQNRAVTHKYRSKFSDCYDLNPFGLLGFKDARCNPLLPVKHYGQAAMLAQCLQVVPPDAREPLWPESAADFLGGLIWLECCEAQRDGRAPTLENVFGMLSGDYTAAAKRMVEYSEVAPDGTKISSFELASAGARFRESNRTILSIVATAIASTRWLRVAEMRRSLSAGKGEGIDWTQLKRGRRPLTVYCILDADKIDTFAGWLKLMVVSALTTLYQLGESEGRATVFMLSEMAALGRLDAVLAGLGQGRKYGIRFAPMVWQNIGQMNQTYGRDGAGTITGNSGCLFGFAPEAGDCDTAEFLSRAGGEHWVKTLSASDDPQGGPCRITVNEHLEKVWPPDAVRSLPPWHGLVWRARHGAKPVPVVVPPYWTIPKLARRASPDPYHLQKPRGALRQVGSVTRYAALSALVIAAGAWLASVTGYLPASPAHVSPGQTLRVDPPKEDPPAMHHKPQQHARR